MAVFGGLKITNSGMNLEAKAQMGKMLKLKRIALGDGQLTSESIITMTKLINETLSCEIKSIKLLNNNIAKVTFYLTNKELETGFTWRELGIIAEDPDTHEELLYSYGNTRENSEYISAKNGQDILELYVSIDLITSNANNIIAIIDESLVFATKQELEAVEEKINQTENLKEYITRRKNITLSKENWVQNTTTGKYEYRIDDITITENDDIDVRIEDEEQEEAFTNIEPRLYSYNGYYVFTAKELIEVDIEMELVITRTKAESEVQNNVV